MIPSVSTPAALDAAIARHHAALAEDDARLEAVLAADAARYPDRGDHLGWILHYETYAVHEVRDLALAHLTRADAGGVPADWLNDLHFVADLAIDYIVLLDDNAPRDERQALRGAILRHIDLAATNARNLADTQKNSDWFAQRSKRGPAMVAKIFQADMFRHHADEVEASPMKAWLSIAERIETTYWDAARYPADSLCLRLIAAEMLALDPPIRGCDIAVVSA